MAKQTKSTVAPAANTGTEGGATPAAPAEGTAPVAASAKKVVNIKEPNGADKFTRVFVDGKGAAITKKNAKGETIPWSTPQVKVIATVLEGAGEAGMSRKDLVAALIPAGLATCQPASRILSYYQKELVENGVVVLTKAAAQAAAPSAPAAEAPAA